ncbi:hypothetical protein HN51_060870 [Arachis hypogaea]|uniref:Uncharacterized protein n=1 Tax=Arachis hypogaea TaxID=3818 RepID=A0A444XB65_ARAHY|nr:large ribosomal RNA subunit accumulation protein YCED homolog 1, chloroplastic [Arachis ipaensis]XP_025640306.1 large ribosomal RNA subunit accumulation protein YCED homolog 1, chloroplastic [Arachis hypogaea]QHO04430.1 uncharacterized protein DS421_13g440310 [Arachis hypogaea]QHO04431.1 uncharacterized protein DS421_13g440310 [Arachis hypogaea]RYQ86945.1 hypothetical protein Ahy_B10g106551 isoform A [Arachis hypogaea]
MSLLIPSSAAVPLQFSQWKTCNVNSKHKIAYISFTPFWNRPVSNSKTRYLYTNRRIEPNVLHKYTAKCKGLDDFESFIDESMDWDDDDDDEVESTGSPWEGAVIYKRNASISHVEYCTTLESLGLGNLSTDLSKNRASVMGLRVTKAVKDYPNGTPVQISIDVVRKKKKLRLEGIIKTVIGLLCSRCGMPSAESVFSEFSLLLTEEPIEEPETIDLGVIYGEDIYTAFGNSGEGNGDDDEDNDALIDLDDRLHFPLEDKEIDISKNIRDRVHLEITMNSVCDPWCKGICMKCGQNFNTDSCNCNQEEVKDKKGFGPLGNLKEQMHL